MNIRRRSGQAGRSGDTRVFNDAPDVRRRGLWLVLAFLAMATAVFAKLPPVLVVVLMQRLFVKGLIETEK